MITRKRTNLHCCVQRGPRRLRQNKIERQLHPQPQTSVAGAGRSVECQKLPSANCYSITFVRDLTRCETALRRLPVGGSNQAFGHQQEGREDQGVNNRDRDHASGKAAVVVIKVCP